MTRVTQASVSGRNLIAGEWIDSQKAQTFASYNPAHEGVVVGQFPSSNEDVAAEAVAAATCGVSRVAADEPTSASGVI